MKKKEQLPNISGCFGGCGHTGYWDGAFYIGWDNGYGGGTGGCNNGVMNAARCSGIYGASGTVQPDSIVWYCCIHV